MAASRYRKFLRLCQEWPLDETKRGRDLGKHIRDRVAIAFKHGEHTKITDEKECDRMLENLQKINTDYYKNKYPRLYDSTATLCTLEQCTIIVSTDFMEDMNELNKGTFQKLREAFWNIDKKR
ncbi:ubiquinol-cytochrome c reductase complex assembly factor 2-like [Saccoglossus kowalevskii]|uniref:Mitochondrial nucleoid factor 1 n=1 Tax=Saccoglossus kowalevskii TaxID=10224 RepID=A0ABM0M014_SACKO|nr:PREDICTED: ubiquinol-cytochrome-c reductase complex assembly factor 2-like isoform X1 [Saccoglossus kowalevskii]XP_006813355.1 PREDICTED: ubiquinol-cytochrome-c reductase complex assembly factor 2-like isoform X2 [Saccoglossus kowalevskii]